MTELQAWVTGILAGELKRQAATHDVLDISVDVQVDDDGNYKPEFLVTGNQSGAQVRVYVVVA